MGSYHVGASLMGTVFAFASSTTDITTTPPEAVTTGIWFTFVVAVILIIAAQCAMGHLLWKQRREGFVVS